MIAAILVSMLLQTPPQEGIQDEIPANELSEYVGFKGDLWCDNGYCRGRSLNMMAMDPEYLAQFGDYKYIRVAIDGDKPFNYVRSDHLARLGGDPRKIMGTSVFGPFPSGALVRVRRDSFYDFVIRCPTGLRTYQAAITIGPKTQAIKFGC